MHKNTSIWAEKFLVKNLRKNQDNIGGFVASRGFVANLANTYSSIRTWCMWIIFVYEEEPFHGPLFFWTTVLFEEVCFCLRYQFLGNFLEFTEEWERRILSSCYYYCCCYPVRSSVFISLSQCFCLLIHHLKYSTREREVQSELLHRSLEPLKLLMSLAEHRTTGEEDSSRDSVLQLIIVKVFELKWNFSRLIQLKIEMSSLPPTS